MRIAFVSNVCYPFVTGGAEKRIYEIGTRLADKGHDVTLYARHYWDGPEVMEFEGMTLRAVSPERELYTGDDGERSIIEAIEFAKDVVVPLRRDIDEYDVVIASIFPYFPVLAAKLSTLGTGTPLITTWHEVWRDYWDDYLGQHLAPFAKAVEHATARVPQYPIAVSETTGNQLAQIGPGRDRIRVVPNGIDYHEIRGTTPAKDGFDILFAGRLIEDKRVDLLLRAFDRVSTDETLGILGDGPMREELEAQAAGLKSAERITFTGFLEEYEGVLAQMHTADIFASPSTREGFGLTYAEAMAAGCTVIAAEHPDSAADEVINDAGFLATPTVDGVAEVLERALDGERPPGNPVERARTFSWDQIAEDALRTYLDALNGKWE